jgi:hypothetical protein
MGCLLGMVAAVLPSLLCGLLALGLASLTRNWLEAWQKVPVSLLGREITTLDFVELLGLQRLMELLHVLTTASGPVLTLVVLALALLSATLLATIVILVGLAYNLLATATGGVTVEMSAIAEQSAPEPITSPNESPSTIL